MSSPTFDYDRPTDTLYIKLRPGESVDNEILCDGDIVIDIGADGAPLGYEIQHAVATRFHRRDYPGRGAAGRGRVASSKPERSIPDPVEACREHSCLVV
jgi:uncharacterized protein YuzE